MASRFIRTLKAVIQLDLFENLYYLLYQCLLRVGFFRLFTPTVSQNKFLRETFFNPAPLDFWPTKEFIFSESSTTTKTIKQAEEILGGKFRRFGIDGSEINLSPKTKLRHWSKSLSPLVGAKKQDIKCIWEPARFSWAITLAQAFYLTNEEKYAHFFWKKYAEFIKSNPLNQGANWESAQEVALRLISLIISINLMKDAKSSTVERKMNLYKSIADHADRIPTTISYAKAQNNNHLISEAVGLFTAGIFLPEHLHADKWKRLGLKWFYHAVNNQISEDGEYIQHSNNYHRLMLTLAVWMKVLLQNSGKKMESQAHVKLSNASNWLMGQFDLISGQVPNLGHNDGSLILPFCPAPYNDYRPILQAASHVFLDEPALNPGPWDGLCIWLGIPVQDKCKKTSFFLVKPSTSRIGNTDAWASLRATRFTSRPAHADQLHVDLWYHGHNIALDAGTFQYNAPPPWDNGLAQTMVHNTLMINKKDQMYRAGRFLWLDWAQSKIVDYRDNMICAEHYGYQKLRAVHRRTLKRISTQKWEIIDLVFSPHSSKNEYKIDLHWLLPNWPLQLTGHTCTLSAPFGSVMLHISSDIKTITPKFTCFIKGRPISENAQEEPLLGWFSPTYDKIIPALSIRYSVTHALPVTITSQFTFSQIN